MRNEIGRTVLSQNRNPIKKCFVRVVAARRRSKEGKEAEEEEEKEEKDQSGSGKRKEKEEGGGVGWGGREERSNIAA